MKTVYKLKPKSLKDFFRSPKRWCKQKPVSEDGMACCLYGAWARFSARNEDYFKLKDTIDRLYPKHKLSNLVKFNDSKNTTFADIQRVVKEANV